MLGSFCCFVFGIPLGSAVATGIVGLAQVRDQRGQRRGMAIAGLCCGAAAIVLPIVFLVLSFTFGRY